jgi:hypothetical protein
VGILEGTPLTAVRNRAIPLVDNQEFANWASEQADLLAKKVAKNQTWFPFEALLGAAIVRRCGGNTGRLPVAQYGQRLLSIADIASEFEETSTVRMCVINPEDMENEDETDEIYGSRRLYDGLHFRSDLLIFLGPPSLSDAKRMKDSDYLIQQTQDNRRFRSRTLKGAIIEALAKGWSTSVDAILKNPDTTDYQQIGTRNGKPVSGFVMSISKPPALVK